MLQFRQNPRYLLDYCIRSALFFVVADLLLYGLRGMPLAFDLRAGDAFFPVVALLLCGLPSSIMHNCAHGNVGSRRVNRLVGELCGTIMLYGFGGFRQGHMFHHMHPDNPKYDPHPPQGKSFAVFLISPIKATLRVIETAYYEQFGKTPETIASIRWQTILFNAGIMLRIVFWVLLLGPKLFLLFYLPLYLSNIFVFAHINYATHVERPDGQSEIINLHEGLYYRLVNFVSFGGYYHKNHHLRPKAFNPARLGSVRERPLLTHHARLVAEAAPSLAAPGGGVRVAPSAWHGT